MKVMQMMAGAQFGGAEAFFTRLAIAFQRPGLDQRVVIREDENRARLLREGGIEPMQLPFGGAFDFGTRWAIRRAIKEYAPDIVLTWMNRASAMTPRGKFVHVGRLGGYYNLKYYKKCQHLIANTQDIVEYLRTNGWPDEKVHYLPNFVSAARVAPIVRRSLYTPDTAPLVLALGRLHENKAFDTLLDAIARVHNVYLWLAGEGPLRAQLEQRAETLGIKPRVRFLGWREDVEALYATADIFVCPSRHEPLGNVVIEAWAQGIPVIATDSLGPGTLIKQNETGVLVPVDDSAALGRSIKHLAENPTLRDRLAEAGYNAYQAGHTEQAVVDQYMKFFQKITGQS